MWEWLLTPIDPARIHEITATQSWHARLMFVAWGILAPLAIIIARFLKVTPNQHWPHELDNQFWWRCHWMGQTGVVLLSLMALLLIARIALDFPGIHGMLGYLVLILAAIQVLLGTLRGTKGGPTDNACLDKLTGDHYNMTRRRRLFELAHKSVGYLVQLLAFGAIALGFLEVNAPRGLWLSVGFWWLLLMYVFMVLQRRKFALDTYQAIWGPDPQHPGNRLPTPGWGMHRRK